MFNGWTARAALSDIQLPNIPESDNRLNAMGIAFINSVGRLRARDFQGIQTN